MDGKPGGLSPRILALFHQLINGSLKQAVRQRLITYNPAEGTTKPPVKRKEVAVLNADQINTYIATARGHRLYVAFVLDLTTGLRRGELMALKRDALDLTRGTLTVRQGVYRTRLVDEGRSELQFNDPKTESGRRTIPLRSGVVRELREHLKRQAEERLLVGAAWQDNNLVFCTPIGTPVEPRNFHKWHTEILQKAGLPHVTLHALRPSFASLVADTGENPENLRAILGHSKTSTIMDLYCHANEEGKRRAVNRLDGLINISASRKR